MSKNYSLSEIKSLLETVKDQVISILLDPSPNSNSHFFQNFTHISIRAFKYLNHYLNVLQRDEKIGRSVSLIYENFSHSFNEYKGRNIYAESYLSTPLAISKKELQQEDEIYHFMNTRNTKIPLGCLGSAQIEKERLELALFVEQMQKKKKITLKEPKRSLQMHQEPLASFKVTRKTTQDRPLKLAEEDPTIYVAEVPAQAGKMENIESFQTQTDCLLYEFQTQTEKQQDQAKSQAQIFFKSEANMVLYQSAGGQVKKKNKVRLKNKNGSKITDGKSYQKKKKAHISSSVKIAQLPGGEKQSGAQIKPQAKQETSMNNQCSIKAISSGESMQLSSKQVNILFNKNFFQEFYNELESGQNGEKEDSYQTEKLVEIRIRLVPQMGIKTEMPIINQEEYYHSQLKSDSSWKAQNEQRAIKTSQQYESQHYLRSNLKQNSYNVVRKSQILPIVSIQIDQNVEAGVNTGQATRDYNQKRFARNHQTRLSRLEEHWPANTASDNNNLFSGTIVQNKVESQFSPKNNEGFIESKQNMKKQPSKGKAFQQHTKLHQSQKESSKQTESREQTTQISFKKQNSITQLQNRSLQEDHLAPINQNNSHQRFSKLNVRRSKLQNLPKQYKKKFMHSTDYLEKYVNKSVQVSQNKLLAFKENVSLSGNSFNKNSLIVINNRHKTLIQRSKVNQKRQSYSVRQTKSPNKSKVKLIIFQKLNHENPLKKLNDDAIKKTIAQNTNTVDSNATKSINQNEYLYHSSTKQSLNESCIKQQKKPNMVLMNQRIAESCHLVNSQSQFNLIAKELRQKSKRQTIKQYLELIEISHRKFCGEKCAHIENLYKKVKFDGSKLDENIAEQLLRLIKKGL